MYKDITDNQLLDLIKENDEVAFEEIINRYSKKLNTLVATYKPKCLKLGLDISDVYQEGLLGLIEAMRTYDEFKDSTFKTYANILMERTIIDAIKANDNMKNKSLNTAVSLDEVDPSLNKDLYSKLELAYNIDDKLLEEEDEEEVRRTLTEFELKVFELKMDGKTNKEISIILDKTPRSIENTIQRIKQKIKETLQK